MTCNKFLLINDFLKKLNKLKHVPKEEHRSQIIPLRFIIPSSHSSIHPTPSLIGHLEPLLCRQPWNVLLNSPAYIHPSIPPSCLPNLINLALHPFCPTLSSPPERFIPLSLQTQDIQYLKWNRMNIKGAAVGSGSLFQRTPPYPSRPPRHLSLSNIFGSQSSVSSSSMIKSAMSSISHADESCFLYLN